MSKFFQIKSGNYINKDRIAEVCINIRKTYKSDKNRFFVQYFTGDITYTASDGMGLYYFAQSEHDSKEEAEKEIERFLKL